MCVVLCVSHCCVLGNAASTTRVATAVVAVFTTDRVVAVVVLLDGRQCWSTDARGSNETLLGFLGGMEWDGSVD